MDLSCWRIEQKLRIEWFGGNLRSISEFLWEYAQHDNSLSTNGLTEKHLRSVRNLGVCVEETLGACR